MRTLFNFLKAIIYIFLYSVRCLFLFVLLHSTFHLCYSNLIAVEGIAELAISNLAKPLNIKQSVNGLSSILNDLSAVSGASRD